MGKQVEDDCQYMEQFIVFFVFFYPLEGSPFHSLNSHPCLPKFESETPYWKSQAFTAGASPWGHKWSSCSSVCITKRGLLLKAVFMMYIMRSSFGYMLSNFSHLLLAWEIFLSTTLQLDRMWQSLTFPFFILFTLSKFVGFWNAEMQGLTFSQHCNATWREAHWNILEIGHQSLFPL